MLRSLFWLILSFLILVLGSEISSEANELPIRSGSGLAKNVGSSQSGTGGGGISFGGQHRVGASGRGGHRIPKPEKDERGRRKGKAEKRKAKKKRKRRKKGCKKRSAQKHPKRKTESLSLTEQERLSKAQKRKSASDDRIAGNSSEKSGISEKLKIRSERADDIPLLLGIMRLMGMDRVIDNHIPVHW